MLNPFPKEEGYLVIYRYLHAQSTVPLHRKSPFVIGELEASTESIIVVGSGGRTDTIHKDVSENITILSDILESIYHI